MKSFILALILAAISYSQQQPSSSFLNRSPPNSNQYCRPLCKRNEVCVFGRCIRTSYPTDPTPIVTCTGNQTCQNGYCLPKICAPCPPGVYCIWNMPCPQGFDCNNGKCIQNCRGSSCKAKRCLDALL